MFLKHNTITKLLCIFIKTVFTCSTCSIDVMLPDKYQKNLQYYLFQAKHGAIKTLSRFYIVFIELGLRCCRCCQATIPPDKTTKKLATPPTLRCCHNTFQQISHQPTICKSHSDFPNISHENKIKVSI